MKTKSIRQHTFFCALLADLQAGRRVRIEVSGRSMQPCLRHKQDYVWLSASTDGALQVGNIVLAYLPLSQRYVLHRVVKRMGDNLTLQGDAHRCEQEACVVSDVLARVEVIERGEHSYVMRNWFWAVAATLWSKYLLLRKGVVRLLKACRTKK